MVYIKRNSIGLYAQKLKNGTDKFPEIKNGTVRARKVENPKCQVPRNQNGTAKCPLCQRCICKHT